MVFKIFLFLLLPLFCFAEVGYVEPWGKNAGLKYIKEEKPKAASRLSPMGWLATQAILFHQNVITQIDGPRSHFRPSSSQYMKLAIQKYGFLKGFIMGCDRLLRENEDPWIYRTTLSDGKLFKWDEP
ncbi:MAG TPA: membrane protein insertion efficiency factor YidD [Rhabdochlamydiaceae bacterium]|nr:membrane protein insertion efficiency factor YidD [Rhabdochlamydiaceae bacterium]